MKSAIKSEKLAFEYIRRDEEGNVADIVRALDGISVDIQQGTFLAILGHNGCGKSTLARHLNALLFPTEGALWVGGKNTSEEENTLSIRKEVGMVFQNPDNQIVGTVVEEDVAFGLENIGVETKEIWNRVEESLRKLGMDRFRYSSPNRLSGGQKQRTAIAGVLAMQPKCIVLDEATAMLDPKGREEVLEAVMALNRKEKITIILITHYMEEALYADQVLVMDKGSLVMAGTPKEIFSRDQELEKLRLCLPPIAGIARELRLAGLPIETGIMTEAEFIEAVKAIQGLPEKERRAFCARADEYFIREDKLPEEETKQASEFGRGIEELAALREKGKMAAGQMTEGKKQRLPILVLDRVSYRYGKEQGNAVDQVSFSVDSGEFLALLGVTGSGKSTLLQLMNGLLKSTEGAVYYRGQDISEKGFSMPELRQKIGLVFQYPEYQLFETTVVKDVMYGPENQGLSRLQAQMNSFEALKLAGIGEDLFDVSPFDLSGGQKRRVAIAGVLAMKPELMVLDEPAAGLDPQGKKELFAMLRKVHKETGMSVLVVSHSMEDAAEYADRILVMQEGKLVLDGAPEQVFSREEAVRAAGLSIPAAAHLVKSLQKEGMPVTFGCTRRQAARAVVEGLR